MVPRRAAARCWAGDASTRGETSPSNEKTPPERGFLEVAGAGFEPATFGLSPLHLWLDTHDRTGEGFALQARDRGVLVTATSAFYIGAGRAPSGVRVSLSAPPDRATLATGLEKLPLTLTSPTQPSTL
jgi:hypothetical protein